MATNGGSKIALLQTSAVGDNWAQGPQQLQQQNSGFSRCAPRVFLARRSPSRRRGERGLAARRFWIQVPQWSSAVAVAYPHRGLLDSRRGERRGELPQREMLNRYRPDAGPSGSCEAERLCGALAPIWRRGGHAELEALATGAAVPAAGGGAAAWAEALHREAAHATAGPNERRRKEPSGYRRRG